MLLMDCLLNDDAKGDIVCRVCRGGRTDASGRSGWLSKGNETPLL